jgi:hypothetical protein
MGKIEDVGDQAHSRALFFQLRGIATHIVQSLGGGEEFIRAERDLFDKPPSDEPSHIQRNE